MAGNKKLHAQERQINKMTLSERWRTFKKDHFRKDKRTPDEKAAWLKVAPIVTAPLPETHIRHIRCPDCGITIMEWRFPRKGGIEVNLDRLFEMLQAHPGAIYEEESLET